MTAAVTEWFPGDQKPEIVGVYERDIFGYPPYYFSSWNGNYWKSYSTSVECATYVYGVSDHQSSPWRGLASDPKGTK